MQLQALEKQREREREQRAHAHREIQPANAYPEDVKQAYNTSSSQWTKQ